MRIRRGESWWQVGRFLSLCCASGPGAQWPHLKTSSAQRNGMDHTTLEEKKLSFLGPPPITNQSSIFIFKCKNKKKLYIYIYKERERERERERCADMCAFSKGEKPFWPPGAKLEASSLVRKRLLLSRGWGWKCLKSWLLGAVKPSLAFKGFSVPCPPFGRGWTLAG